MRVSHSGFVPGHEHVVKTDPLEDFVSVSYSCECGGRATMSLGPARAGFSFATLGQADAGVLKTILGEEVRYGGRTFNVAEVS